MKSVLKTTCCIPGCSRKRHQKSRLCSAHHSQRYRNKIPLAGMRPIKPREPLPMSCSLPNCERPAHARAFWKGEWNAYCSMHTQRVYKNPERLSISQRLIRASGEGTISRGYRIIHVNGRRIYEHRYVMEQVLGHPLTKNEHVHHRNGNWLDNRSENLVALSNEEHKLLHFKVGWRIHEFSLDSLKKLRADIDGLIEKLGE